MKGLTLAALVLLGAGMAASPALAAPVTPGAANTSVMTTALDEFLTAEQVDHRKWGKKKWRHGKFHKRRFHRRRHRFHDDDDFGFSFGFGFPLVGFGLGHHYYRDYDCIGWWHRHRTRLHCHGQLVWD